MFWAGSIQGQEGAEEARGGGGGRAKVAGVAVEVGKREVAVEVARARVGKVVCGAAVVMVAAVTVEVVTVDVGDIGMPCGSLGLLA